MAKHNVYFTLPVRELGKVDANFYIYQDDEKLGQITISKGSIQWYPNKAKRPYNIPWSHFDKMVKGYYEK